MQTLLGEHARKGQGEQGGEEREHSQNVQPQTRTCCRSGREEQVAL